MSKRAGDRRKIERRAPKQGVTVRHDDRGYVPKRVRRGVMAVEFSMTFCNYCGRSPIAHYGDCRLPRISGITA